MRFRAIFACMLTVMLLSLSCAAPDCEIRCNFAAALPACHRSVSHQRQQQPMAEMPRMASSEIGVQNHAVAATVPSCTSHVCAQQQAFLLMQRDTIANVSLAPVYTPFVDAIQFVPEPTRSELSSRGPPPFAPVSPVSLRTSLRV